MAKPTHTAMVRSGLIDGVISDWQRALVRVTAKTITHLDSGVRWRRDDEAKILITRFGVVWKCSVCQLPLAKARGL